MGTVRAISGVSLAVLLSFLAGCGSGPRPTKANEAEAPPVTRVSTDDTKPGSSPDSTASEETQVATFGGGCFWCIEAVFEHLKGVESVTSGYTGGSVGKPTYEQVCTGLTGHAEVVQIIFDPKQITYDDLLDIFFTIHDPTTLNRQGADVGTQYRSAVFTHSDEQAEQAQKKIAKLTEDSAFRQPIVTEITPLTTFYPAEQYHQGYYRGNEGQPYCQMVVLPKLAKFRKKFGHLLKPE
jgi:peptide-methionine (S)-S-oxide reductase